jgi:hypothetical protein
MYIGVHFYGSRGICRLSLILMPVDMKIPGFSGFCGLIKRRNVFYGSCPD